MIVAVAKENDYVAQHFGRCPEYALFTINDGKVTEEKVIPNPGHEPGFLPKYLAEMGVSTIIAGGMGPKAQSLFCAEDIETFIGVNGMVTSVIGAYLSGELKSGESECEHFHG